MFTAPKVSFEPLLEELGYDEEDGLEHSFEELFGDLLPEYLQDRASFYARDISYDEAVRLFCLFSSSLTEAFDRAIRCANLLQPRLSQLTTSCPRDIKV